MGGLLRESVAGGPPLRCRLPAGNAFTSRRSRTDNRPLTANDRSRSSLSLRRSGREDNRSVRESVNPEFSVVQEQRTGGGKSYETRVAG